MSTPESQPPAPSHPPPASSPHPGDVEALRQENESLRAELRRYHLKDEVSTKSRKAMFSLGWRILIPLLDRKKVVKTFAKLTSTVSEFTRRPTEWPTRDRVITDARDFMTACVRFAIRRRMFFLFFSLLAAAIPAIQIKLVCQQNEIIEKTNELFEIQVNDMIARSVTESADSNTRRVSGVLLANAKGDIMRGVVEEIFDPDVTGLVFRKSDLSNKQRQLADAAFRGLLIRAVSRGAHRRGRDGDVAEEIYHNTAPMFVAMVADTAKLMPELLRVRNGDRGSIREKKLIPEADYYMYQVGYMLQVYRRLSSKVGEEDAFYANVKRLFQKLGERRDIGDSLFVGAYRYGMEGFLLDLALDGDFGDGPVNLAKSGKGLAEAMQAGIAKLREELGTEGLDWATFAAQMEIQ